jgi:uracil phosphoribosyltransferase
MKQQINFRASDLTSRQLDALMQHWGTSQTETLTVVIDRIYQQEIPTMTTDKPVVFVSPEMLGDIATDAAARRMVELLTERGFDAQLGSALHGAAVPEAVWGECLDIISQRNGAKF